MCLDSNSVDDEQFGSVAGLVVARLARHVERAVAGHELSLAQYRVLGLIGEGEAASSRIAEKMAVTRSSISAVVDGLVTRGLVERGARATDRRLLPLTLTAAGRQVLTDANVAVGSRLGTVLSELDERKAGSIRTAFTNVRLALDRHRERRAKKVPAV